MRTRITQDQQGHKARHYPSRDKLQAYGFEENTLNLLR